MKAEFLPKIYAVRDDDLGYIFHFLLQVVQELALVMYAALDTGLKEDEERTLTPGLENLLGHMISAGKFLNKKSLFCGDY